MTLSSVLTLPIFRPRPLRNTSRSLSLSRFTDCFATRSRGLFSPVIEYPKNLLLHGRHTLLFVGFTFRRRRLSRKLVIDSITRIPARSDLTYILQSSA